MIGEDACAFGDREVLDYLHDKFRGTTRTHQCSNSSPSALRFGPGRVSLQNHHVDYVFVFLEPP